MHPRRAPAVCNDDCARGAEMLPSARVFAVPLATSALLLGTSAMAQDESPTMFNPPPPDIATNSYSGSSAFAANRRLQAGVRVGYASGTGIVYSGLSVHE